MLSRVIRKLENHRVIDETTQCWLFTGSIDPNGYGKLTYNSKSIGVHRLSAHIWLGYNISIRYNKEQVNHKPDCPNKHCFNPEHLYVGTQKQNVIDYYKSIDTGICPKGHPNEFMYEYTSLLGKKFRWCRMCRTENRHKYWKERGA